MRRSNSSSSSGFEIHLHAQAARRFVDEVDRLVGQEAVGDVAIRELSGRDDRRVRDAHAVMEFVFLLQAAQDRDRVFDGRFADEDRLEAPREGRVFFDVLAVFVERGGADAMQFAARERGLEQVRGVHRAFGFAGADERVHFVDEEDDAAGGGRHFGQDRLQAFLELAAIFRAGDQRAHVERHQLFVFERFRHVAVDDAQRQAFDDRRLADAGFADEHGVVLGAAREHLHGAADFFVAPDHGVEFSAARGFGQVAGVFFQRVIALLGGGAVGGAALAQIVDRFVQFLRREARVFQNLRAVGRGADGERQQDAFDGDETVARFLGDLFGFVEHARGFGRHVELAGARAFDARQFRQRRFGRLQRATGIAAGAFDEAGGEAFLVVEQNFQQMFGGQTLMAGALRQALRVLQKRTRAFGEFF